MKVTIILLVLFSLVTCKAYFEMINDIAESMAQTWCDYTISLIREAIRKLPIF